MPDHSPRPPGSWITLLLLFTLASFVEVIFWGQLGAFTPLYLPHLGVPTADIPRWLGLIAAISTAVGIPFLPLWGALADRYARQPIIVRSFVAHLLAGALVVVAGNVWIFLLARAIQSFALGNSGLMMTTLAERAPRERQGLAFSIMNGAAPLGAFVGPLLGGPVVDTWGFPALIALDTGLLGLVILVLVFGYRDPFRGSDRGPLLRMAWASLGIVWRSARLRALFPALFLLFAGWMLVLTYVPLVIGVLYHGPDPGTTVGFVLGAGGLTTLLLSPLLGWLADRWGHWRVLVGGGAGMVLLWPLPALVSDLWAFGLAWALINGLAAGVFAISFSVLSDSAAPAVRGRVMTFAYLPVTIGGAVGPALGGLLTAYNLFAVFPAAAGFTALGVTALVYAHRQPGPREGLCMEC